MKTRVYSYSTDVREVRVTKVTGDLELEDMSGYVTCYYDNNWWLGSVLETLSENAEVKVSLLHPSGPSWSYRYPTIPMIVTLCISNILVKVDPHTRTGRTYTITQKEKKNYSREVFNVNHNKYMHFFIISI